VTPETQPVCVYCGLDSDQVPLLELTYRQERAWICSAHLPVLIHKPEKLIGSLPGAEDLPSAEGHGHN
jgi:hypothetical protein